MHLAQAVETIGSNSTLLGAVISGTLFITLASAYRFVVNFRNTERGLARQRIRQANRNERTAQHEASLWQQRCADLEYLIRSQTGLKVPALSDELQAFVSGNDHPDVLPPKWEDATERPAGEPGK